MFFPGVGVPRTRFVVQDGGDVCADRAVVGGAPDRRRRRNYRKRYQQRCKRN
jgi:hypothetical protein